METHQYKCTLKLTKINIDAYEPHHDKVAVVFVGDDGVPPFDRDIVVYPKAIAVNIFYVCKL